MNPIVRNILAVLAGIILGMIVNMTIIQISPSIIPPPEGIDPTDMKNLKTNIHLFEFKHFIFPFLAHALGTLVGAFVAIKIAVSHYMRIGIGFGLFFMVGGIMMAIMLPFTMFTLFDLIFAYLPMGWLGWKLAGK
jgi:hypothetical protein